MRAVLCLMGWGLVGCVTSSEVSAPPAAHTTAEVPAAAPHFSRWQGAAVAVEVFDVGATPSAFPKVAEKVREAIERRLHEATLELSSSAARRLRVELAESRDVDERGRAIRCVKVTASAPVEGAQGKRLSSERCTAEGTSAPAMSDPTPTSVYLTGALTAELVTSPQDRAFGRAVVAALADVLIQVDAQLP